MRIDRPQWLLQAPLWPSWGPGGVVSPVDIELDGVKSLMLRVRRRDWGNDLEAVPETAVLPKRAKPFWKHPAPASL